VRLNVMTDISDQKLAQKLHIEHQSALHHTARLINLAEAATTLAHELNQPLLAIVAYNAACIRLLESGSVDLPTVGAAMKKCRTQAVRAGEIVRRMRELARRRAPQLADCDLNAMIRQQLEWSEDDLAGAGVTVEPDLEVALPHVQADRLLIEQVLVNLVQNAIDAMRNTDPAQRALRIGSRRADQGRVTITVADRGEGIAPAVGERLFSTFFTTKATGLGLGLSICRSVIELHGGRLWHDANPGGGTAFHFTLPEESA
jgi:C4-dicarboxylate-specific signal transduction histidine kinase